MAVPTARKSCKTPHYGRSGRCGRYFGGRCDKKIALLAAPSLPDSAMSLQSRMEYRSSHYAGPRRPEDLTGKTTAQISLYTPVSGQVEGTLERVSALLVGVVP